MPPADSPRRSSGSGRGYTTWAERADRADSAFYSWCGFGTLVTAIPRSRFPPRPRAADLSVAGAARGRLPSSNNGDQGVVCPRFRHADTACRAAPGQRSFPSKPPLEPRCREGSHVRSETIPDTADVAINGRTCLHRPSSPLPHRTSSLPRDGAERARPREAAAQRDGGSTPITHACSRTCLAQLPDVRVGLGTSRPHPSFPTTGLTLHTDGRL